MNSRSLLYSVGECGSADHVVDLGPRAGTEGGGVVFEGTVVPNDQVSRCHPVRGGEVPETSTTSCLTDPPS